MLSELRHSFGDLPLVFRVLIFCLPLSIAAVLISNQFLYLAIFFVPLIVYIAVHHMQALLFLLIFTIPISITWDISSSLTTDFPDEPIMWAILIPVTFLVLSKPQLLPEKFWNTPIITLFVLLYFWATVTTVFSTEMLPSVKYMLAKTWYLGAFVILAYLVFRDIISMYRAFAFFMTSFTLFLFYALYKMALSGFDFEEVNFAVMPIYSNHVNFSATLACVIPLVVLWLRDTKILSRKVFIFIYLLLLLVGLYFSYGRAAWLSVIVAMLMVPIIKMRLVKPAVLITYVMIGYGIFWITDNERYMEYRPNYRNTYMRDNISDHIVATFQGTDVSSMERVHRWIASIRMSQEYPVLGVGPNNFYEHYRSYVVNEFRTWVSRNLDESTSHNYFLIMLTEQGFIGMILYAILLYVSLVYGQRLYFRSDNRRYKRLVMTITCCLAAFYVNNFLSELIESDELGSIYYMLTVVLVVLDLHQDRFEKLFPVPGQEPQTL